VLQTFVVGNLEVNLHLLLWASCYTSHSRVSINGLDVMVLLIGGVSGGIGYWKREHGGEELTSDACGAASKLGQRLSSNHDQHYDSI
jgi:hypothetical protein